MEQPGRGEFVPSAWDRHSCLSLSGDKSSPSLDLSNARGDRQECLSDLGTGRAALDHGQSSGFRTSVLKSMVDVLTSVFSGL